MAILELKSEPCLHHKIKAQAVSVWMQLFEEIVTEPINKAHCHTYMFLY